MVLPYPRAPVLTPPAILAGYTNSKGAAWPRRSDGMVLRRILKVHGLSVTDWVPGRGASSSTSKRPQTFAAGSGKRAAVSAGSAVARGGEPARRGSSVPGDRRAFGLDDDFAGPSARASDATATAAEAGGVAAGSSPPPCQTPQAASTGALRGAREAGRLAPPPALPELGPPQRANQLAPPESRASLAAGASAERAQARARPGAHPRAAPRTSCGDAPSVGARGPPSPASLGAILRLYRWGPTAEAEASEAPACASEAQMGASEAAAAARAPSETFPPCDISVGCPPEIAPRRSGMAASGEPCAPSEETPQGASPRARAGASCPPLGPDALGAPSDIFPPGTPPMATAGALAGASPAPGSVRSRLVGSGARPL